MFILLYLSAQQELFRTATADDIDDEKVIKCEYSDTEWQPLNTQLYTCDIFTQKIDSPGYKIKFEPGESEKVEGLSFNDNKNLNFLPNNIGEIFPNLKGIIGTKTYLNTLDNSDLKGLSKLKYLNFASSDLKVIDEYTFTDLIALEELDLSDSDIRYIDEDAMRGMTSLKTLYLGANKLSDLEPKTFEGLTSLESLSLELNHLEHVDDNLFSTNDNLADIWLNGNKIVSMSSKVFDNIPKLSYVDLQANPCVDGVYDDSNFDELKETLTEQCASTHVIRKVYEKTKNVIENIFSASSDETTSAPDASESAVRNEFNIDGDIDSGGVLSQFNKFGEGEVISSSFINDPSTKTVECSLANARSRILQTDVETCEITDQLIDAKHFKIISTHDDVNGNAFKSMSFAQNKNIKFLPDDIGKFAPNLVEFSARNASLQVLSKKNFAGLKNLRSLNLADNKIKHIDSDTFDALTALEELDLSGNELESIDEDVFSKLKNLKTLRIGHNKFHSIHPNLFRNLRNLANVSISHQQIENIPEKLFNANAKLKNIWMNSNKVKSISPNMFAKLKDLEYVDVRDNKCIDTFYDDSKFGVMKDEILVNCGTGYELKKGVKEEKSKKTKKPKKDKKKKKKEKKKKLPKLASVDFGSAEEEKEVTCDYEEIFWPHVNKTLHTCVINEPIDDENYFLNANLALFDDFDGVQSIEAISFANNKNVKHLPKNIQDVFPNLVEFSAANSGLTSINPHSLKGLTKLKSLNLSNNGIKTLQPEIFEDMTSLEELILDDNDIEEFDEEIFTYFKVLKRLRMKGNKLKFIEESWFDEMPELHDFTFEVSESVDIESNIFKNNKKLKWISMNGEYYDSNMQPINEPPVIDEEEQEEVKSDSAENIPNSEEREVIVVEISCIYKNFKTCEIDNEQVIDNANYVIKSTPQNEDVTEFIIRDNENAKYLPSNIGTSFPNLESINVINTPLSTINRKVFENMPNLNDLTLSKNKIKAFEHDTFDDLPELEELNLSENLLENLEDEVFYKLKNLRFLHLGNNNLHYIHPKMFKFMPNLHTLSVDNNNLSVLDPQLFKNNPNLQMLYFDHNSIETLNPKMFDKLKMLMTVSLKGNNCIDGSFNFEDWPTMKKQIADKCKSSVKSKSKEVYCDFKQMGDSSSESDDTCEIDEYQVIDEPDFNLSIDSSANDPSLVETFSISNNDKIKFFPQNVGEMFPNLQNFYAVNDSLDNIPENSFKDMKNVKKLNLSKNKLKTFDPTAFDELTSLEELDLSENDIETLDENTLPRLPKLKKINISGNKIKFINPNAFKNIPELIEVVIDMDDDFDVDFFETDQDDITFTSESVEITENKKVHENFYPEEHTHVTDIGSEENKFDYDNEIIPDSEEEDDNDHEFKPEEQEEIQPEVKPDVNDDLLESNEDDLIDSDEYEEVKPNVDEDIKTHIDNSSETDAHEEIKPHVEDSSEPEEIYPDYSVEDKSTKKEEQKPESEGIFNEIDSNEELIPSTPSSTEIIEKEVTCELDYFEWKSGDGTFENLYTCIINDQTIDDENYKIKPVPKSGDVHGIKIDDNKNVQFLPENIGEIFPSLKKLSASNNSISNLPQDALKNLNLLQSLNLSNNQIDDLDAEMFSDAPHLEDIDLSGNKIIEIPDTIFFNSPLLKTLKLDNNELNVLPLEVFEKIPNLSSLTIDEDTDLDENIVNINPSLTIEVVPKDNKKETKEEISIQTTTIISAPPQSISTTTQTSETILSTTTSSTTRRVPIPTKPTKASRNQIRTTTKASKKLITCEIIFEPSEYQGKTVMKCQITDQKIDDPEVSLHSLPNGEQVEVLKLDNNKNIKYLPENIANILPNLIEVSAKNAAIDTILPGDFEDLENLQNIDLSGNVLKIIEPETFDGLSALKNLDLSENEIEFIDEDAFGNLPQLQSLNLESNDITFLHPKTFENMPNLQTLNIDSNDIPQLHKNLFKMNPNLNEMKHSVKDFDFTVITTSSTTTTTRRTPQRIFPKIITTTTTRKPQQLTTSTTARNRPKIIRPKEIECEFANIYWIFSDDELFSCDLKDVIIDDPNYKIKPSPRNKRVRGLSFLDNKNVKFLPQDIAQAFPNLIELSAFNTSIKNIPNNALKNLPKLRSLNLMSSELSSIDPHAFDELPSLENLDLSSNNLYDLSPDTFKNLPSLKMLYIADNKLRYLDPQIFENLPELRNVSLENNEVPQIDRKLFGKNYELQNVWLNGNKINAIDPAIFDGKRALEYVDLRGNECIDVFFEGYGIEGIRNKLRSSCKSLAEVNHRFSTTTTSSRPLTTFTYSVFENPQTTLRMRPTRPQISEINTQKPIFEVKTSTWRYSQRPTAGRGPQSFLSQPYYPEETTSTTTTSAPAKEVTCSLNYHDFPNAPNPIYTCIINDQPIDDQGYVIKLTPHNNYVEGVAIDDNSNVKFLPENIGKIFPNLKYLSARNDSIDDVLRNNFDNLPKLRSLDLSDNNLSTIDPETFNNLPTTEEINLRNNKIAFIFNETFVNFPYLKDLDLSRNKIELLNPSAFISLPELQKLALEHNELTKLPDKIFSRNPMMENINLSGNKLNQIDPETFENLPNLKEVNLDENNCINGNYKIGAIKTLKFNIMKNCVNENYIPSSSSSSTTDKIPFENYIPLIESSNDIECQYTDTYSPGGENYLVSCVINADKKIDDPNWKVKEMPDNKRVKRFFIDNNKSVKKLPKNLAESFPDLIDLVVKKSPLKSISPDDLKNLENLKKMSITDTSIRDIEPDTFSGAPYLQDLDLSKNNLRNIDDDAFNGLSHLQSLDLSGNKIPKLSNEVFKKLPQLKTLKLTGNDLENINGDLFKKNPKLYKLNLDDNNLKSVDPDAFDRLPQLLNLDLSKNDCIDRAFGISTMHLMRQTVNDNCQPFTELKSELKSCKKEIKSCKNELAAKPNAIARNGDDEKLLGSLRTAQHKIKQLNLQIDKLRNALNNEKESLSKEIEKSRELQMKLDKSKHKCAKIDHNHNFIIDLNCEFTETSVDNKYECDASNLKIATENTTIEDTKGSHKPNKNNYDVTHLVISNQDVKYLPNDISRQFPYLKELIIDNSKLKNINQVPLKKLPHLKRLIIKGNDIDKIDPKAFTELPQLEYLDLSRNNIKELPVGVFEKLPNLKALNLNENALLSLPHDIIRKTNNLREFTVSNNNLNFIDPRIFKKLSAVDVIDFANNKCIDEKFDANVGDFMAFVGGVNLKCINNDDDNDEDGTDTFCKGRKVSP